MITATAMMADTMIPSQLDKRIIPGDISPWVMAITSTTLLKAINIKATKIMIQATLARDALSSHKALMAATTCNSADDINPIIVNISGIGSWFLGIG
jgi:hypothetical protein